MTYANAEMGVRSPANGAPLAPTATVDCTALHAVPTRRSSDLNYLNTACVDDGAGGAAAVCGDRNVPSVKAPHLSIVKTATEASYNTVGQTIHYTSTAHN